MRPTLSFSGSSRASIAALLVMAMLFAQWVGLAHSVTHAGWEHGGHPFASSLGAQVDDGNTHHHSCAAFDAATLSATLHTAPFIAPLLPNVHVLALWIAFASWHAPFTCHFSSRAPPFA